MPQIEKMSVLFIIFLTFIFANANHESDYNSSRFRRQANNSCELPDHPSNGWWAVYDTTSNFGPGMSVPSEQILIVQCRENYILTGSEQLSCIDSSWSEPIGECLKTCSSKYSSRVMNITCIYNDVLLPDCQTPLDGTIAQFECASIFYELRTHRTQTCIDGTWSNSVPECEPICGRKIVKKPTLIINGQNITVNDNPWQVAIYNLSSKVLICGGSLISERIIVTAAHCLADEQGNLNSKKIFKVAVGKTYRPMRDIRDCYEAQFSSVQDMFIPDLYKGDLQNYAADIGIIVTKRNFTLSSKVLPVCIDWELKYHHILVNPSKVVYGYVGGWGYTMEYKQPSEILKLLKVPTVTKDKCRQHIPENYERFLTDDKLCAGFLNASSGVCIGDSGGGLVSRYGDRYYLMGIVSTSPQADTREGGCDSQGYALYTKVSDYVPNFLLERVTQFGFFKIYNDSINCEDDSESCMRATTRKSSILGKSCTLNSTGGQGLCTFLDNCTSAQENLKNLISPEICRLEGRDVIVCCGRTNEVLKPVGIAVDKVSEVMKSCVLPEHPEFGFWKVNGAWNHHPGQAAESGDFMVVECKRGYKLEGAKVIFCSNEKWLTPMGRCLKMCSNIHSTKTLTVTCLYNNIITENCTDVVEGALAKYQCPKFYEYLEMKYDTLCENGWWNQTNPDCVPVCGQEPVDDPTLIIEGSNATKRRYPWHTAIYTVNNKKLICSGSLISDTLIVTAALCVTDDQANQRPKEQFIVAVNKYYSKYDDSKDKHNAQFSTIDEIFIREAYAGKGKVHDIAIMITTKTFVLSSSIFPVCIDFNSNFEPEEDHPEVYGYMPSWGYISKNASLSNALKELKVPYASRHTCYNTMPYEEYIYFQGYDKECGGYFNQSTSVCTGDTGAGLVFKHDGRYFLKGVLSFSPQRAEEDCDRQQSGYYTKLPIHLNFINSNYEDSINRD